MQNLRQRMFSLIILAFVFLTTVTTGYGQSLKEITENRVSLPNGWDLTPVGKQLPLGDLPLNIAVSPSGKMLAVTNNGQSTQSIQLFDSKGFKLLDSV